MYTYICIGISFFFWGGGGGGRLYIYLPPQRRVCHNATVHIDGVEAWLHEDLKNLPGLTAGATWKRLYAFEQYTWHKSPIGAPSISKCDSFDFFISSGNLLMSLMLNNSHLDKLI